MEAIPTKTGSKSALMSISGKEPFSYTTSRAEVDGWSYSPCVTCTNGPQSIDVSFNVRQEKECEDQLEALAPTVTYAGAPIVYNGKTGYELPGWDMTKFFKTLKATRCPITNCVALDAATCSTKVSYVAAHLNTPFQLEATAAVADGYTSNDFCLKCRNKHESKMVQIKALAQEK